MALLNLLYIFACSGSRVLYIHKHEGLPRMMRTLRSSILRCVHHHHPENINVIPWEVHPCQLLSTVLFTRCNFACSFLLQKQALSPSVACAVEIGYCREISCVPLRSRQADSKVAIATFFSQSTPSCGRVDKAEADARVIICTVNTFDDWRGDGQTAALRPQCSTVLWSFASAAGALSCCRSSCAAGGRVRAGCVAGPVGSKSRCCCVSSRECEPGRKKQADTDPQTGLGAKYILGEKDFVIIIILKQTEQNFSGHNKLWGVSKNWEATAPWFRVWANARPSTRAVLLQWTKNTWQQLWNLLISGTINTDYFAWKSKSQRKIHQCLPTQAFCPYSS